MLHSLTMLQPAFLLCVAHKTCTVEGILYTQIYQMQNLKSSRPDACSVLQAKDQERKKKARKMSQAKLSFAADEDDEKEQVSAASSHCVHPSNSICCIQRAVTASRAHAIPSVVRFGVTATEQHAQRALVA